MSLYHEGAEILSSSSQQGVSLKSRIFGRENIKSPPSQLYALVYETCKWSAVLKEVIDGCEILRHERKLTPILALLLVHDLLLAKGGIALPKKHGLRSCIDRHKARLSSELTRARLRRKASTLDILKNWVDREAAGEEARHPRWLRINTLKTSVEEQLETTFRAFTRVYTIPEIVNKEGRHIYFDAHVPSLVAVPHGHDLSKTAAYLSGKIIFQDKASCFPAYLLDPRSEDGDVIDACAAPGNKTTHLASIVRAHMPESQSPSQTIFSFEKDTGRAQILEKMIRIAGAKDMVRIGSGQDFLQVDPTSEEYRNVGALLLDPSCSGSGIVGRDSVPDLHLPAEPQVVRGAGIRSSWPATKRKRTFDQVTDPSHTIMRDDDGNETALKTEKDVNERLKSLASFQLALLLHAFRFPSARKVTYSTCSIHSQENEHVVMAALGSDIAQQRGWRILSRDDQISGMKSWPVRGIVEACQGNAEVAEACVRSYKNDGHGVMGFFVAAFVRYIDAVDERPYLQDSTGVIVRNALGTPTLRASMVRSQSISSNEETVHVCEATTNDSTGEGVESEWEGIDD